MEGPASQSTAGPRCLVIACGAVARELLALIRLNGWQGFTVTCLPAIWHNRPERIAEGVRGKIRKYGAAYDRVIVAYGDCGTGGALDAVIEEEGAERISGPHCYSFYAGAEAFEGLQDEEIGTFYLTDYLVRHFDRLIIAGLGLDRHPDLLPVYFGNYRRVVYLAQTEDADLTARAEAAARRLGLDFERRHTGFGELGDFLARAAEEVRRPVEEDGWPN